MNLLCLYLFPALPFSFFPFSLLLCTRKLQKARRVISVSIFSFASPDVIWSAESQLEPCKRSLALCISGDFVRQMILQDHVRHVLLFAAAETLSNQWFHGRFTSSLWRHCDSAWSRQSTAAQEHTLLLYSQVS